MLEIRVNQVIRLERREAFLEGGVLSGSLGFFPCCSNFSLPLLGALQVGGATGSGTRHTWDPSLIKQAT